MIDREDLKILNVDQYQEDSKALEKYFLRNHFSYQLITVPSLAGATEVLEEDEVDLVLMDYQLKDGTGFDLMRRLGETAVIFLVRDGDENVAVRAMRAGALDYLVKDDQRDYLAELPGAIAQALSAKQEQREKENYRRQLEEIVSERAQVLIDANQRLKTETEQRARAVEDRQQNMLQQVSIDDLSAAMASTLDLEVIYQSIQLHLQDLFDFQLLLLAGFDPEQKRIQIKYQWQSDPMEGGSQGVEVPESDRLERLLSRVISSRELLNLGDISAAETEDDPAYPLRWDGRGELTARSGGAPQSALLAPLNTEQEVIGVLYIQTLGESAYDYSDAAQFMRAVNVIALGLRKAYLYETSERQLERLSALHSIDQAIFSNLSLPSVMDALRDQLVNLLAVDAVDILLYQPGLEALKIITQAGFRTNPMQHTALQLGEDPGGQTAASRKPTYLPDLESAGVVFQRSEGFEGEGFRSYYGFPLIAKGKVVGVLEIFHRERLEFNQSQEEFISRLAGLGALAIEYRNLIQELKGSNAELLQAYEAIIKGWAHALETRGIEAEGHAERVVELTLEIAERMGVGGKELRDIQRGAYLHDVGKMGIPDEILLKQGSLTVEERKKIGRHPVFAYQLLESIQSLRSALNIPLYHHERWDGRGYPEGLQGEDIPLSARIFAVVDVWDSLRSDKPYRDAWPREKALNHIREDSGKHFDPRVVEVFLEVLEAGD
ncbi:MAG: HD domain-containing phosphohydrolase [Anaerolineales bacterium]|nr:HD domain-containing phosphohydrolase [Anaerolineales bacterium]